MLMFPANAVAKSLFVIRRYHAGSRRQIASGSAAPIGLAFRASQVYCRLPATLVVPGRAANASRKDSPSPNQTPACRGLVTFDFALKRASPQPAGRGQR